MGHHVLVLVHDVLHLAGGEGLQRLELEPLSGAGTCGVEGLGHGRFLVCLVMDGALGRCAWIGQCAQTAVKGCPQVARLRGGEEGDEFVLDAIGPRVAVPQEFEAGFREVGAQHPAVAGAGRPGDQPPPFEGPHEFVGGLRCHEGSSRQLRRGQPGTGAQDTEQGVLRHSQCLFPKEPVEPLAYAEFELLDQIEQAAAAAGLTHRVGLRRTACRRAPRGLPPCCRCPRVP